MNLDLTEPELRHLLASVGITYQDMHREDPAYPELRDLEALYMKLHAALRTKYEALDARHAEVWYDYEETLTELQNTVSAYDELRTKYEALRTACQALLDDCSEDPDLRTDIQDLIK